VVKGVGPIIPNPLPWHEHHSLSPIDDPASQFPFLQPIFEGIKRHVGSDAAAIGFIGSPWTVMAYAFEGRSVRHLERTKRLLMESPSVAHSLLSHISDQLAVYALHQIDCGAELIQIFDSWAHHLSEEDLEQFSLPYAQRIASRIQQERPNAPVMYHANGSCGKLNAMARTLSVDVVSVDWATSLRDARHAFGSEQVLQGNIDPTTLLCSDAVVQKQAHRCWDDAGRDKHILNIGHGVLQSTPPDAPASLINASYTIAASSERQAQGASLAA
jgi:uroporphyrinogen decarboxylase